MNQRIFIRDIIILITIIDKWDKDRNSLGWDMHTNTQYTNICVSDHMCFSPKIQQPIRSIECSKGSPHLMNTTILKII